MSPFNKSQYEYNSFIFRCQPSPILNSNSIEVPGDNCHIQLTLTPPKRYLMPPPRNSIVNEVMSERGRGGEAGRRAGKARLRLRQRTPVARSRAVSLRVTATPGTHTHTHTHQCTTTFTCTYTFTDEQCYYHIVVGIVNVRVLR